MKKLLFGILLLAFSCNQPGTNTNVPDNGQNQGQEQGQEQEKKEFTAKLTTLAATDITESGAVLHASYEGVDTEYAPQGVVFRYGTSSESLTWQIAPQDRVSGPSGEFSAELWELTSGQTYYFQATFDAWNPVEKKYTPVSGEVLSFTTKRATYSASQPTWPELPLLDYTHHTDVGNYYTDNNNPDLYYTHHWSDEKTTASGKAFQRNYSVCWNAKYKCPVWVAALRHEWYENGNQKSRKYAFNPDMPREVQYNATSGSGTYNRGHMLGAAERNRSATLFNQVNYITNIGPQNATYFNTGSGGWNTLEDWVDGQVCTDTLYIVVGCYFEPFTDGYGNHADPTTDTFMGTNNVQIPTMMYYLLLRTKNGKTGKSVKDCSASELKCAAFVRAHASGTYKQKVTSAEMMSVSDLEKLTGISYFPNVPNAPKNTFSASDWGL